MKNKSVSSIILFVTTTFTVSLLTSCGSATDVVTAANNLSYAASSSTSTTTKPDCKCKNKTTGTIEVSTEETTTKVESKPTASPIPNSVVTDKKNIGDDLSFDSNLPNVSAPPAINKPADSQVPAKKKTLVGQWIEKIGNLFKKKKTV